jgi:hypothetical protein
MARITALLVLALASSQAFAAEPWDLVWVSRSTDWFVKQAHGQLEQPFGSTVVMIMLGLHATSRVSPNNSFKPKPLRGSA